MPAKKYFTEEERKAANKARYKAWKKANRERINAAQRRNYWQKKEIKAKREKYKQFTKKAQQRPVFVNDRERLTAKQKAILSRIATAITADDIE